MIFIADSGSTKTNWCLIKEDGRQVFMDTEGYNPYIVTSSYIIKSLEEQLTVDLPSNNIHEIHFYGAGCFPERARVIREALAQVFPSANIFVELDLLAAARSLLGRTPGFAAILGTGTNSCMYDGSGITANIDSLGYILGDEGSGAAMGKKLLADFARGYMPETAHQVFYETFRLSKEDIFHNIYSNPLANRFCASFCPFIQQNLANSYFHQLVAASFTDLFTNLISHYKDYTAYSFNCVGSVAYIFRPVLEEVAAAWGMTVGTIRQTSIEGLVGYHGEAKGAINDTSVKSALYNIS